VKAIAGKADPTARPRSAQGDRTVAELYGLLEYDLKIQVAKEIGIDSDYLVIGRSPLLPGWTGGGLVGSEER
jgi:hypothetical protein